MAKIVFYDTTELDKQHLSKHLETTDHNWDYVDAKITDDNIDPDAEVISVFVTCVVTRRMIDRMPKLKLIACRSTGFNNVDLEAAESNGVIVVNVPTYGESTVAEYAFTLLLGLVRKLPQTLHESLDTQQTDLIGRDLYGKTFGVIGTGHIGQKAIHIAKGFGMQVVAYDPFPNEQAAADLGFSYKELDEVAAVSDYISLHAPFTQQTHHLVNTEFLEKMKDSAILVNTARGELVDTKALIMSLHEKKIAGAALDVVEGESVANYEEEVALLRRDQIPPDDLLHSVEINTLEKMPNVLVTPHNAFNTIEAIERINSTTAQNIITYWYGETPNRVKAPEKTMGKLFMVRHTESEWNATGQWTGSRDVHLSENGFREAALVGHDMVKLGVTFDISFCSEQIRTLETLEAILNSTSQLDVPLKRAGELNERDYGDYTGMNKFEVRDKVGEEQWNAIRRGWDVAVPNGETLRHVYERVIPYFEGQILPYLREGKNVLLVAHGNSLRALIKFIEDIPDHDVAELEMLFGDIVNYQIDELGKLVSKAVTHVDFTVLNKYKENSLEASRNIG